MARKGSGWGVVPGLLPEPLCPSFPTQNQKLRVWCSPCLSGGGGGAGAYHPVPQFPHLEAKSKSSGPVQHRDGEEADCLPWRDHGRGWEWGVSELLSAVLQFLHSEIKT